MRRTNFSGILRYKNGSPDLRQMTRPSDSQQQKQKTCRIVDFAVLADPRVKQKESKMSDKYLDLSRELKKKIMEHESDSDTNCNWRTRYSHLRIGVGNGGLRKTKMSEDHPKYSIIEVGQNTEKSPEDLWRLAHTQTPKENYQLKLV